ncbi:MAG: TolC family outer membrane protein [Pseudomonadota bacterium]
MSLKTWLTRTAIAAAVVAAPVASYGESLTDALIAAYRHSHILDQQRALLRATDENVAQAVARVRPVLNFVASLDHSSARTPDNTTRSIALNAQITIFDNGRNKLAIDAAKESVLAAREALVGAEQTILLAAVEAYTDVLTAIEFVNLRRNNVRLITEELRAARDRFEVGEVTRTDVALAEARLAETRSLEAAAVGQLAVARESYRQAIGRYPGTLRPLPAAPKLPRNLKEAERFAVRLHPSIRQAQRNVTVSEINIASAEAALKFTVTGSAGYNLQAEREPEDGFTASITLNQPIYQGGALTSAIRAANANRDANRAGLLNTTHTVRQQVGNAWASLAVAVAQLEATDRQITAARIAFRGVQEEAKLGSRTTLDVLDAEQELQDALADRVQAQNNKDVAIYTLLSAIGMLTVDHLGLGIQTYDPAEYYNAVKSAPIKRSKQGQKLDRILERLGQN